MFSIYTPKTNFANTYIVWRVSSNYNKERDHLWGAMHYFSSREEAEKFSDGKYFIDAILEVVFRENNNGSLIPKLYDGGVPREATDEEIARANKHFNEVRDWTIQVIYDHGYLMENPDLK